MTEQEKEEYKGKRDQEDSREYLDLEDEDMDMKDRVEFVALTKEEIESMIAKAALAGASVAAETMEKAYRKSRKN